MGPLSKRAIRRAHRKRIREKRSWYYYFMDHETGNKDKLLLDDEALGMAVDTPTLCSCWMCGNPRRKLNEKTRQELRAELDEQEEYII